MKTKKPRSKAAARPAVRTSRGIRPKKSAGLIKVAAKKKVAKRKSPTVVGTKTSTKSRVPAKLKATKTVVARRTRKATPNILVHAEPQVPLATAPAAFETAAPKLVEAELAATAVRKAKRPVRKPVIVETKPEQTLPESTITQETTESDISAPSRAEAAAAPETSPAKTPKLVIPPILFEGDTPASPAEMGPGQKYALGPTPPAAASTSDRAYLPSSYGTGKLFLVARDPHWLYAHWDLGDQQQRRYNSLSVDRHLVVRVTPGTIGGHSSTEIHVHPESRHWFIHVDRAATNYTAELGYYPPNRKWVTVATAVSATTPVDTISSDRTIRFATIPLEKPLRGSSSMMRAPTLRTPSVPTLDETRERTFAKAIARYFEKPQLASSVDIPELMHRPAEAKEGHGKEIVLEVNRIAGLEQPSSPQGGEAPAPRGFWLNVNAELVLYGATEPDATLLIDGYPVQLRPDGTFSYRFALPDGDYEVALWAMSADGDSRQAVLKFRRASKYEGEVGAHPQDPALTAPPADHE